MFSSLEDHRKQSTSNKERFFVWAAGLFAGILVIGGLVLITLTMD